MVLDGVRVYNEGVAIGDGIKSKIRQIVHAIKALSPSSEISMKFIKSGPAYEVLVWGSVNGHPIGLYNRGPSMGLVLETIFRRAKKECLKTSSPSTQALPLAG
jgi:hypothetical protein